MISVCSIVESSYCRLQDISALFCKASALEGCVIVAPKTALVI